MDGQIGLHMYVYTCIIKTPKGVYVTRFYHSLFCQYT